MDDPTERLEWELAVAKRKYSWACVSVAEARVEAEKWRKSDFLNRSHFLNRTYPDFVNAHQFPWEVAPKRSIHDVPLAMDIMATNTTQGELE